MVTLRLHDPAFVVSAVREYDHLGRDEFLRQYGYGRARRYYLLLNGKLYDSKAVCGVAFGMENPNLGPLASSEFSGGESTVARVLESLGFTVVRQGREETTSATAPLVLVENEVTMGGEYDHWMDQTGVRYQYPNAYRNRVREGRPFVYYRGVRRTEGRRGRAEYFGVGRIGTVSRDESVPESAPKARWKWFCEIEDYVPFDESVPARRGGRYFEQISGSMGWRTGVRDISDEAYRRILEVAGLSALAQEHPLPSLPDVRTVTVTLVDSLASAVLRRAPRSRTSQVSVPVGRGRRHSARTKAIGDRAEEIVYRWLRRNLAEDQRDSVDWVARRGQLPGWDIEYADAEGKRIAVEVKGTFSGVFSTIEITPNEWAAAEAVGPDYWLYLVTSCTSQSPRVFPLKGRDPAGGARAPDRAVGLTPQKGARDNQA